MTKRRKISDFMANAMTYFASFISILMLVWIFFYIFSTGMKSFDFKMLTTNYWSTNYKIEFESPDAGSFEKPGSLGDSVAYSVKYGVGFEDVSTKSGTMDLQVVYIASDSPLNSGTNAVAGETLGQSQSIDLGSNVQRITYVNSDGSYASEGNSKGSSAAQLAAALDQSVSIDSMQYQTPGGGVGGSLKATLMLIGMTLLFALPVGIFAAIYLHELAPKNRLTRLIRSSIEMLAGVPSIIFGLMGVAVLFPITAAFGIKSTSILLGSLTLAIMLLPVIIRNTEEALIVVPNGFRDGSLSLGATETQTIFKVVLPSALPGILSAVLLSIGRIIGESAALIFTMGTFIMDKPTLTQNATSLAVQIWSVMSGENPNFGLACAISIIILVIVLILNLTIKLITARLMKKWSA